MTADHLYGTRYVLRVYVRVLDVYLVELKRVVMQGGVSALAYATYYLRDGLTHFLTESRAARHEVARWFLARL
jgi:hypothetical protein